MVELNIKEDIISSLKGGEYLKITNIEKQNKYFYKALIVENHFSIKVKKLIDSFWECVDLFSISLADDIEREIIEYNFKLVYNDIRVFDIEIKENEVFFYIKYPTAKGFLDSYSG